MISEYTLNLLKESGWDENLKLDIEDTVQLLKSEGFPVFESVRAFLSSFNGLELHFRDFENTDNVSFNIEDAIEKVSKHWVLKEYSSRVKTELCIIGQAYGGYMVLCMDKLGHVYGGYDQEFFFFGSNSLEAIDVIVLRDKTRGREIGLKYMN